MSEIANINEKNGHFNELAESDGRKEASMRGTIWASIWRIISEFEIADSILNVSRNCIRQRFFYVVKG